MRARFLPEYIEVLSAGINPEDIDAMDIGMALARHLASDLQPQLSDPEARMTADTLGRDDYCTRMVTANQLEICVLTTRTAKRTAIMVKPFRLEDQPEWKG